jgi:hypothetical protein
MIWVGNREREACRDEEGRHRGVWIWDLSLGLGLGCASYTNNTSFLEQFVRGAHGRWDCCEAKDEREE